MVFMGWERLSAIWGGVGNSTFFCMFFRRLLGDVSEDFCRLWSPNGIQNGPSFSPGLLLNVSKAPPSCPGGVQDASGEPKLPSLAPKSPRNDAKWCFKVIPKPFKWTWMKPSKHVVFMGCVGLMKHSLDQIRGHACGLSDLNLMPLGGHAFQFRGEGGPCFNQCPFKFGSLKWCPRKTRELPK